MAARKTTKKSTRKKAASRGKSKPASTKKTTARGKRSTKSTPAKRTRKAKPTPRPIPTGMSLDRKLDIVGIALAGVGLLSLLSLLSPSNGSLMGWWVGFLGRSVGWGQFILPLGLIGLGAWLVVRNIERVPQLSLERITGIILIFVNFQAWLQFIAFPETREASFALAAEGGGGGYLGAFFMEFFRGALGWLGAAIALLAWLLIGLALTLDVSVPELFRWMPPLVLRIQDWWDERRARRAARAPAPTIPQKPFTPILTEPETPPQTAAPPGVRVTAGIPTAPPNFEEQTREYVLPVVSEILDAGAEVTFDDDLDRNRAQLIEETLASFGAPATVVEINRGPTITQFGVEPAFIETNRGRTRVRVGKIAALADDLALALAAQRIRIQAPVPGKGFVGIEVPNEEISMVALRDVVESEAFQRMKSPLRFALGQDVAGHAVAADLAAMPHMMIAGATGSGKSVSVNAIITCLLLHNTPDQLRLVMIDPKRVELTGYNGIPHLLSPVVVDLERVVSALQWVTREMDQRYHKFAQNGVRNISEYNRRMLEQGEKEMFYLVVVVDELADLMMIAPDETERLITRMAQLARATGIHMVISTQRPSVDVVTGLIKANLPARIAFAVASSVDSRVIIDQPGAERLLGRGDMLFQAPDAPAPVRMQGVFVSDHEIIRLVQHWRPYASAAVRAQYRATELPPDAPLPNLPLKQMPIWEEMEEEKNKDPIYDEAVDLVRRQGRASISMLQRRLRIGYTRAARLIDYLEEKGIVGVPVSGSQTREVLDYGPAAPPVGEE